jgi:hypothetical protein
VAGVAREHRLEDTDDLSGAIRRLTVERPELPRAQIHQALGVERGRVEIVGVFARQVAHGVGVLARQRGTIGLRFDWESDRHRLDVPALDVRTTRR